MLALLFNTDPFIQSMIGVDTPQGDRIGDSLCQQVRQQLATFSHPTLQQSLADLGAVKHCLWQQQTLQITLQLPFVWQQGLLALRKAEEASLCHALGADQITWQLKPSVATLRPANDQPLIPGIRNILAISSAKGGVGKSSMAVNLALALAAEGGRVGLLDADIYGPSIPLMSGTVGQRPLSVDGRQMIPIQAHGLAIQSIGYLLADTEATLWRGPMASRALEQLLRETLWPDLDYLLIDMPPGTGDLPLTLAQRIPVTAAISVTTPQQVAVSDTLRGIQLFEKLSIPVLGVIENMSAHCCSQCGHLEPIFGSGGGEQLAQHYRLPLLGKIPLQRDLQDDLDQGYPTVIRQPDSELTALFRRVAVQVATSLYWGGQPMETAITVRNLRTEENQQGQ
jgi:ATP-binding protein involved in chromosome partitioning